MRKLNWHILLGFGLGLILSSLLWLAMSMQPPEPDRIERLARELGMVYPNEVVPFSGNVEVESDKEGGD